MRSSAFNFDQRRRWPGRRLVASALALAVLQAPMATAETRPASSGGVDREYERLLAEEEARTSPEYLTERMASGLAALGIGLYGYYNDDRGILTRVIYSTTQTAGILMVSDAIQAANRPSLLVRANRYFDRYGEIDEARFRRLVVAIERQRQLGEIKQRAYTSMILASIYGYNGYREKADSVGLKNVFYFLSFNFTLVSAANFYRLFTRDQRFETAAAPRLAKWELAVIPYPTLTVRF